MTLYYSKKLLGLKTVFQKCLHKADIYIHSVTNLNIKVLKNRLTFKQLIDKT